MGRQDRDASIDVDAIIAELGHGKFHVISFVFIAIAIFFNSLTGASFIFTARDTEYRCYVPGCDAQEDHIYQPKWLSNAVPYLDKNPTKCDRKIRTNQTEDTCERSSFLNTTERCDKWVYGEGETIVKEFDIACEEWKIALVGTINSIGQFVCLSFSGLISDTLGRRSVMVYGTVLSGLIGAAQSYANDFWTFLFFEFLVTAVGSGAYSASFILGIEIMVPEKRVLGSTIMNVVCGIATVGLGIAAWSVSYWRSLLRLIYFPSLIMIFSFWMIPESIRWLMVKGRRGEATRIINRAAKMNGVTLSEKLTKYLEQNEYIDMANQKNLKKLPLKAVLRSRKLIVRLLICIFCWMTNAFVYYGMLLNAVSIFGSDENPYLNFIFVSLVELPAQAVVVLMLDSVGRRICLSSSLIGSALSCFAFILIPNDQGIAKLIIYLLGKLLITVSFNVIYIYTTELFPTSLRHSILGCCSMMGRIGSMLAPQTPLLSVYFAGFPMVLFGTTAIISGFSILIFPETLKIKLPDTIEEAENMCKVQQTTKSNVENETFIQ